MMIGFGSGIERAGVQRGNPATPLALMFVFVAGAVPDGAMAADAPAYPVKPLRLVVPFPAGGTADLLGRLVGQDLATRLGQPVVIDNKAGAGRGLGSEIVARSAPDGYTLLLSNAASHGTAPSLNAKLGYSPTRDFAHIGLISVLSQFFVAGKGFTGATVKVLIAEAKRSPGSIHYATAGVGSTGHFAGELLKQAAGIDLVHVPYKGTAPGTTDLIGGRVQVMFQNAPEATPHIRAGTIRLLAVTSERRQPLFPETPTMLEEGVPGFVSATWYGLSGPAGLSFAQVKTLSAVLTAALTQQAMSARLTDIGFELRPSSPAEYARFVDAEVKKFRAIAEKAGIPREN